MEDISRNSDFDTAYQGLQVENTHQISIRHCCFDRPLAPSLIIVAIILLTALSIDRQEAKELFPSVREPSDEELILEQILEQCVRSPTSEPLIFSLDEFIENIVEETQLNNIQDGDDDEKSTNDDSNE